MTGEELKKVTAAREAAAQAQNLVNEKRKEVEETLKALARGFASTIDYPLTPDERAVVFEELGRIYHLACGKKRGNSSDKLCPHCGEP